VRHRALKGIIVGARRKAFSGRVTFSSVIESVEAAPGGADYIIPGLIDLQVNGAETFDVMEARVEDLVSLARVMAQKGTTSFLPTAITAPLDDLVRVHEAVATAAQEVEQASGYATILGMHLEGPFIAQSRLGVHPPHTLTPSKEALETVLGLSLLRVLTLAPELEGALDAIGLLVERSVVVSMGHSDATLDQAMAGVEAGARMFTHLFNAMRPIHHREPGIAGAGLLASEAYAALIADGVHVHPAMLRLALHARGSDGIILTSDSVALKSFDPKARANCWGAGRDAVAEGCAARRPTGQLAGSLSFLIDCVRVMIETAGATIEQAVSMASTNPARLLGLKDRGVIKKGARADLLVLDRHLKLKAVFVAGQELTHQS